MKKTLAIILALALVFSSFTAAFAEETLPADAKAVTGLGMLVGAGNGVTLDYLKTAPTRIQAAIMVLRLKGLEATAKAFTGTDNFADAKDAQWAAPIMAYLKANPTLGWIGDGTNFKPNAEMAVKDYYKVMLETLGYKQNTAEVIGDFTYASVIDFAAKQGLTKVANVLSFTVNDLATATMETLKANVKGGTKTLGFTLVETKVITEAAAVAAGVYTAPLVDLAATVEIMNTKQIKVIFTEAVDKTTAEDEANYKAYNSGATTDLVGAGSAKLQADGKTVIISLANAFLNGTTAKVTVKNVVAAAAATKVMTAYSNDSLKVADTTVPSVVGVTVTGPQTITVEYSEPVYNEAVTEYTIDDGNYIVTGVAHDGLNKIVVTAGVNFTNGEHKVKFNGTDVKDYADYKVIASTSTFTVAADTTLPTVTLKSATPTKVVLTFSKPVENADNVNVLYRHSYNSTTFQYDGSQPEVVVNAAKTEVTIDFSAKPISLGANNIYIAYGAGSTRIEDLWGNKLAAVAVPINVTLDMTKPTVKEVKFVDNATLKVVFTEEVDAATAETESNYTVKDSAGDVVALVTATLDATDTDNKTILLDFGVEKLGGGSYTIAIKGVKDVAYVKNAMDAYTTTISVNDTVKPTVGDVKWSGAGTKTVKVYVPFSEKMDATKLVKANFFKSVDTGAGLGAFSALGADDSISVAADGKSVTLTIVNSANISDVTIRIGAITDVAGNGFVGIIANEVDFADFDADAVAVAKVEATGTKTLKVTFDGRLSSVSATGFEIWVNGAQTARTKSVTSHTINTDGNSVVILTLGAALDADAMVAGDAVTVVLDGATGTKSYLGTQVTDLATGDAAAVVVDKIVPTVDELTFVSDTEMLITFTEALNPATIASTLNGFSVTNGASNLKLKTVALDGADATGKTIKLTGTGFVEDSTTVSYNSVAGITDNATVGNALASFSDKAQD